MRARRYGLLTTGYPHEGDLIAGCFVREMARALVARGHDVRVACIGRRDGARWDEPCHDDGVRVTAARYPLGETFYGAGAPDALGLGGGRVAHRAWVGAPLAVAALAAASRALATCDVVVSHFLVPSAVIAGLLRGDRTHVAVAHGTDAWLLARAPAAMQRALLRRADMVWCSHEALRRSIAWPTDARCVVRPMGWRDDAATPTPRGAALRVVTVSRLVPLKRVGVAVEALRRLRVQGVDATLTVAGDGPERASLEARAKEGVRFLGPVDAARRAALLADADVFVHAAGRVHGRGEGAPVAVLEAMGAGVAVVACASGGVGELVGDAGVLLPEGADATTLADAIAALARDDVRRVALAAAGRARVLPWRWEETAAWLDAQVDAIVEQRPP